MTVRGAYNDTYFQLQKANELVTARERERDTTCELVKKKDEELRRERRQNSTLSDELGKLRIEIGSVNKRQAEKDKEIDNLRRENKVLKARVNQLQTGPAENKKNKTAANRSNGKNETMLNRNEEYEVEDLLNDEIRKGKRFFLVKWKGYDRKHNTWEQQSNLNCKKVLKTYLLNKKNIM